MRTTPIDSRQTIAESRVRLSFLVSLLSIVAFAGCKSPFDRTRDASSGGGIGAITGGRNLVVFSDELKTGGGAFLYPGGENQILSFNDTSNPISARSIRYVWNGGDISSQFGPEHTFAGFDLMHTVSESTYDSTPGRNLQAAGYTQVIFWARASLPDEGVFPMAIRVDVAQPSTNPGPCVDLSTDGLQGDSSSPFPCLLTDTISSNWKKYIITLPTPSIDLATVKDFFKITFIYNGAGVGPGATVYVDQIQYAP